MKRYLGRIIGVAVGAFGGPAGLLFGFLAGTLVDQTRRFARMNTTGGRGSVREPRLLPEADCQLLSVPRTADRTAVRRAYRQLVVNLHPDSAPSLNEAQRTELAGAFERVQTAYENLMRELHEREAPGSRFSNET